MRKLCLFLSIILTVCLFAACEPDEPNTSSSMSEDGLTSSTALSEEASEQSTSSEEESSVAPESSSEPTSEPTSEPSKPVEVKKVFFIGNSLTKCGYMPEHLQRIGKGRFKVTNACADGAMLSTHVDRISDENYKYRKQLAEADVVVFQEYGDYMSSVTGLDLEKLMKLCKDICKPDTKYYFMMRDVFVLDKTARKECVEMIGKIGIIPLPIGEITSYVRDKYFTEEQFLHADGFHPSQLNGNIMAMAFIIIEEDEACTDGNWSGPFSTLEKTFPDKTLDEINEEMKKIQKDAYEHYQKVKENYIKK